MNRYFIIPLPFQYIAELTTIIVGELESQRTNNNSNKMVVKLEQGDIIQHEILEGLLEYNHAEILIELQKPEWEVYD